jgi:4-hydroxybenzoyl-CoA thioesterase
LSVAEPFVHWRRISWGDTDAARIVYTARVPHFALEAIEAWYLDRLGVGFYDIVTEHGFGTPFVHMDIDFRSPMTPHDRIGTRVLLTRLGATSMNFALDSRTEEGRLCWTGNFACVFVRFEPYGPIPAPEFLRRALELEVALADSLRNTMPAPSPAGGRGKG